MRTLRASLAEEQGVRTKMAPQSSHLYDEAQVAREKYKRWHHDNWAELAVLMLNDRVTEKNPDGVGDLRLQLFETPWVQQELARRIEAHERESAE